MNDLQRLTITPIECHDLPSKRYKIMTSILFKNMGRPWQIEQIVTISNGISLCVYVSTGDRG
jgi:hypothetical protein